MRRAFLSQPSTAKEDKGHDDVVKYDREFMLSFQEVLPLLARAPPSRQKTLSPETLSAALHRDASGASGVRLRGGDYGRHDRRGFRGQACFGCVVKMHSSCSSNAQHHRRMQDAKSIPVGGKTETDQRDWRSRAEMPEVLAHPP